MGLVFQHAFEYLNIGGHVIVVIAVGGAAQTCAPAELGVDLTFPTNLTAGLTSNEPVRPDEIEDGLTLAGFDIGSTELVSAKTLDHTTVLPGEAPRTVKRTYALIVGQ